MRLISTLSVASAVSIFSALGLTAVAPAAVIVSNLTTTSNDADGVNTSEAVYNQFSIGSNPATGTSVVALLAGSAAFSNYTARILTDSSGAPGSVLATSTSESGTASGSISTAAQITFSFSSSPGLSANTNYWLELSSATSATDYWSQIDGSSTNTGTDGTVNESYAFTNLHVSNTESHLFSVNGTVNVPEPTSIGLLGITAAGLLARRRRVICGKPSSSFSI